jgi:tight adherence protein B
MNFIGIGILLFIGSVSIIELLRYAFHNFDSVKQSGIRKRIKKYSFTHDDSEHVDIIKKRVFSQVPFLNRLLPKLFFVNSLDRLITQANTKLSLGFYILSSLLISALGWWGVSSHMHNPLLALLTAVCGFTLPFVYLCFMKRKRIEKFQAQLPDGLDLVARSLRAGHAFNSGMKLAADEFPDPLGIEFQGSLEEINFGVSIQQALKGLAERMDCAEARYFVVAVILQRETGGNLAELLEGLAQLMREKVKFEGKVRALAAEGKITAVILVLTPLLMALYMESVSAGYLNIFVTHPIGRIMLYSCSAMMVAGIIVLRKMVDIKI